MYKYAIPNNTLPGTYVVLFMDSISKTNTSVPIVVRPYAAPASTLSTNANKARPSGGGSIFAMHNNQGTSIYQSLSYWCFFISTLVVVYHII